MKLRKIIFALTLLSVIGLNGVLALAAPPMPEPAEKSWQLDISYNSPKMITVTDCEGKKVNYWYFKFTITNRTDEDIEDFLPEIYLYTNTGELLKADVGVDTDAAYKRVQKIIKDPLVTKLQVGAKILQGEDNAMEMVVFFKDFDPKAGSFKIFFGGLSGETKEFKLPKPIKRVTKDSQGNKIEVETDEIILRKTLQIEYKLSSDSTNRSSTTLKSLGQKWIMR